MSRMGAIVFSNVSDLQLLEPPLRDVEPRYRVATVFCTRHFTESFRLVDSSGNTRRGEGRNISPLRVER